MTSQALHVFVPRFRLVSTKVGDDKLAGRVFLLFTLNLGLEFSLPNWKGWARLLRRSGLAAAFLYLLGWLILWDFANETYVCPFERIFLYTVLVKPTATLCVGALHKQLIRICEAAAYALTPHIRLFDKLDNSKPRAFSIATYRELLGNEMESLPPIKALHFLFILLCPVNNIRSARHRHCIHYLHMVAHHEL